MSKKIFTEDEIKKLSKNKYVKNITEKSITYTDEFKKLYIKQNIDGTPSIEIFEKVGLEIEILGRDRILSCGKRWRKAYNEKGEFGLKDTRKTNSGRPSTKELTTEQLLAKKDAQIELLKMENEFLKKSEQQEGQVIKNKLSSKKIFEIINYLINQPNNKYTIKHLCILGGVSRSGYYSYLKLSGSREFKEKYDQILKNIILEAFNYRGYKKGSRSIKMFIQNKFGIILNRKCIQRIMRKFNIICPIRQANPYRKMAKAVKEHRVIENKLNREFKQNVPAKVLLTDITYLKYSNSQTAYLSTIKDGSTNEILAYKVSDRITLDIALDTIDLLILNHKDIIHKDAFIHSDQGVHYTSIKFQKLLKDNNLGQSMSRRGNCWDNAPQESFFGHMKDELDIKSCSSFDELCSIIDDYMDYYNNDRYQWGLNKLTPVGYRNQLTA